MVGELDGSSDGASVGTTVGNGVNTRSGVAATVEISVTKTKYYLNYFFIHKLS